MKIANRKIIYVAFDIQITPSINQGKASIPLYCEFQPDEVVVKSFSYFCDSTMQTIVNVKSNFISQSPNIILCFPGDLGRQVVYNSTSDLIQGVSGPASINVNNTFTVSVPIQSAFEFNFINSNGDAIDMSNTKLSICLEFIKYKH